MARPWSARCYGVARPREGSRQNSIGFCAPRSPQFQLVLFIPLRAGAEEFAAAKDANYGLWFRPARCCSTGSGRRDLDLMIFGAPRSPLSSPSRRARALMARPWSARCYGVARPREGSAKTASGLAPRSPLFPGSLYPFARGRRRICRGERCKLWLMVSAGAMLLDRLGPPGFRFNDFGAPRSPLSSPSRRARALMARPWSARCYGVARPREGSRQNSIGFCAAFTPFFLVLFTPCAREEFAAAKDHYGLWFRPARCCSTGSGRRDLDLMISGPRVHPFHHPLGARER